LVCAPASLACSNGGAADSVDGTDEADLAAGSGGLPGSGTGGLSGSGGAVGFAGSPSGSGGSQPSGVGGAALPEASGERSRVDGGSYPMGRSASGSDACPPEQSCAPGEAPEHTVSVSSFWLDRFEVTVARLRIFYDAYPLALPTEGSGAHPLVLGSGWQSEFAAALPDSRQELLSQLSCGEQATFTPEPGAHEAFPANCVSWPVAFLFCSVSGGRLPTEAEWERAAAGGEQNRLYPWGDEDPSSELAGFFPADLGPVGAHPAGKGRYESEDLAGGVWEWALDWLDTNWYSGAGASCEDCARVSSGTHRVLRGGAYSFEAVTLRAAVRSGEVPEARMTSIGFRCAYDRAAD